MAVRQVKSVEPSGECRAFESQQTVASAKLACTQQCRTDHLMRKCCFPCTIPMRHKISRLLIGRSARRQALRLNRGYRRTGALGALWSSTDVSLHLHLRLHLESGAAVPKPCKPHRACRDLTSNRNTLGRTEQPPILVMARDKYARQSLGGTLQQHIKEVRLGANRREAAC
jgi:hypothetical protein